MNQVFLSDSCYVYFGTSSATTGAATNADSTPTVVVAEDGTDMGYAPTVTGVATGLYKAEIAATAGNGFEAGRRYNLYAVATVGAITGRDGIGEFEVLAVDFNTGVASVTGNVTGSVASVTGSVGSVVGLTAANLDVAVSTRMETYVQPTGFLAATFPAGTVANTTNITAGTITTTTNLTNLPSIPADWITAAGIAAGAITSSEAPALANLDATVSSRLSSAGYTAPDNATIALIAGYTDSIEGRLPAALVGGRMDASVGALAADTITAASIAADAIAEIQSGLATLASIAALNNITVADILAGASIDPISADVKKMNGVTVIGTGVSSDLWRA